MIEKPLPDEQKMVNDKEDDNPRFSLRLLSLDKAVAPLIRRPVAPFDRTERKRAHTSALFYSECFLNGIEPKVADTAAEHAQGTYDKWWVRSTASVSRLESMEKSEARNCVRESTKKRKNERSDSEKLYEKINKGSSGIVIISKHAHDEEKDEDLSNESIQFIDSSSQDRKLLSNSTLLPNIINIEIVKQLMIEDLRLSGGDVKTPDFLKYQQILENSFIQNGLHEIDLNLLEGNWLTISKPTFTECKGKNEKGENMYSLGRISFDMFKPTGLNCSFQASFNHIQSIDPNHPGRPLHIPRKLMHEIQEGDCILQTYE